MVDDAYQFLNLKGRAAHHYTVQKPPRFAMAGSQAYLMNEGAVLSGIVESDSATSGRAIPQHRALLRILMTSRMTNPTITAAILHPVTTLRGFQCDLRATKAGLVA